MNSKQKGKRGELEVVKMLREIGFEARRTAQYCGNTGDAADVIGVDGLHLEVKRAESLHIKDWIAQAERDSKEDETPVVVFRSNGEPWRVCIDADTFFDIYKSYLALQNYFKSMGLTI